MTTVEAEGRGVDPRLHQPVGQTAGVQTGVVTAANYWRITEHGPNVAMGFAWQWAGVARLQVARVLDPAGPLAQVPDAYQAVFAVRRVRRAAGMGLEHLTALAARDQLREAIEDFDRALPHVSGARDVLEHFEEYTRGVGDRQQPVVKQRTKRIDDEALAVQYRSTIDYIDDDWERPRLHVGPYSVDLVGAADLASLLSYEIWAAIRTEEGQPVSRGWVAAFRGLPERMTGGRPNVDEGRPEFCSRVLMIGWVTEWVGSCR